jgi:Sel1 repeat
MSFSNGMKALPALVAMAIASAGCGGSNLAAQLEKPPEFTPREGRCSAGKVQARPLIVEWPSSDRAALEARVKQGLVPVKYVGCDMEVLTTCHVDARYAYTGITPKSDVVTIHNADELYANIPVHAAKFEGTLQKSGSLNVAMTIIGRFDANRPSVRADELQGDCKEATHVVSALTVGAFRFSAGSSAGVSGGASFLAASAGGKSTADQETLNTDGDEKQCEKATADDKSPPFGCGALLRVELVPLGEARKDAPTCPAGTSWDGNLCAARVDKTCPAGTHYEGDRGCLANGAAPAKAGAGVDALQSACDGGDSRACVTLGEMFYNARGGVAKDGARAAALFKTACDRGEPTGCVDLGWAFQSGTGVTKDGAAAADAFGKACGKTSSAGCLGIGMIYSGGQGVPKDTKRAAGYLKTACDAGNQPACSALKALTP